MISIYGASDDLVEVEGVDIKRAASREDEENEERSGLGVAKMGESDEINVIHKDVQFVIGRAEATEGCNAEGCRVWVHYTDLGVWSVTILPIEEDVPCPWQVGVAFKGYTAVAHIDAPEGTPVTFAVVDA